MSSGLLSIGADGLWLDIMLCAGVIILATLSLSIRSLFKSVALFISLGLLATIAWARLGAVDVAIAEAAIGAGLSGVLLLTAWRRLEGLKPPKKDQAITSQTSSQTVSSTAPEKPDVS